MSSNTIQIALWMFFILFFLGTVIIGVYIFKRFGSPLPRLFFEFDKKMWMTIGLGITFLGLYFFLIKMLSWLFKENSYRAFSILYQYKIEAIYMGLFIFAFLSSSIYLVRIFIKYLYKKSNE